MQSVKTIYNFESGNLFTTSLAKSLSSQEWIPHNTFKGFALKHLVVSSNSSNEISCHLVRIEPECEIGLHTHENNLEIHEVIFGTGSLLLDKSDYEYNPGNISVIPKNVIHKVKAGKDGLYLLAKFIPALL